MKLAEMLIKTCKAKGWTMSRLSKEAKIAPGTLHGWKTGRSTAKLDDLRKVATVLELPLYQLVFGEPDPHESPREEILKEIFSGDVRVTLHRIERKK